MKSQDLSPQQAREFVRDTVSVRMSVDLASASHEALIAAIDKDLQANVSTRRSFARRFGQGGSSGKSPSVTAPSEPLGARLDAVKGGHVHGRDKAEIVLNRAERALASRGDARLRRSPEGSRADTAIRAAGLNRESNHG